MSRINVLQETLKQWDLEGLQAWDFISISPVIAAARDYADLLTRLEDGSLVEEVVTRMDGAPDLYEISSRHLAALETLGLTMLPVKNSYIVSDVIRDLVAAFGLEDTDD